MSDKPQQPLPFIYQFAAGAVAGVSEVRISAAHTPLRIRVRLVALGGAPGKIPRN